MTTPERKRGLGRGLSALMSDVAMDDAQAPQGGETQAQTLPIEWIQANPDQPRKSFDAEDLESLTASIREKGIIQPVIVRQLAAESFQLVAGERRWRAAQSAQLHTIPVVIRDFTDEEVMEIAIIENIQRTDLNPVEEALGYRQLMDKFGHTQEKLGQALGKSRSHIANMLRLLGLPADVLELLQSSHLSMGHARALISSDNPSDLARLVVEKGLSVRETEKLVKSTDPTKQVKRANARAGRPSEKDADTLALEGDLSATLKMKVTLTHGAGNDGGVLSIQYKDLDQLDELCRMLSGM